MICVTPYMNTTTYKNKVCDYISYEMNNSNQIEVVYSINLLHNWKTQSSKNY